MPLQTDNRLRPRGHRGRAVRRHVRGRSADGSHDGREMARSQLEMEMLANAQARRARLERTLASMESLGQHLAGIPGRKNLVWIGGGISMLSVTGAMGMGPHGSIESFEDKVKRTSQKLAQQGIVLYIVDAKGLEVARSQTRGVGRHPADARARPIRAAAGRREPQQRHSAGDGLDVVDDRRALPAQQQRSDGGIQEGSRGPGGQLHARVLCVRRARTASGTRSRRASSAPA